MGTFRSVHYNTIGLEINFEESDYSIEEGSDLHTPIRLQFIKNQNAFTIAFTPVTIAAVDGMGLGNFINFGYIDDRYRATLGEVFIKEM